MAGTAAAPTSRVDTVTGPTSITVGPGLDAPSLPPDPTSWVVLHDAGIDADVASIGTELARIGDATDVMTTAWITATPTGPVIRQGIASIERLRWRNSVGPVLAVRAGVLADHVELRHPAGLHAVALQVVERRPVVSHSPVVAADDRDRRRTDVRAAADAVTEHLRREDVDAVAAALPGGPGPLVRVERRPPVLPSVAVVVPASGRSSAPGRPTMIEHLLASMDRTSHPDELVEIVVVLGPEAPAGLAERLANDRRVRVVHDSAPFAHTRRTNLGAIDTDADVLVLMNDDTEVLSPDWLTQIAATACEHDVGLVGPRLLYADGTLQSAGHAHPPANIGSVRCPVPESQLFEMELGREVSGVTLACAAVRRTVFEEVGGLTARIHNALNDVDLAMKCRAVGLRHVSLGHVAVRHLETRSRTPGVHRFEEAVLAERWGTAVLDEPYFVPDRVLETAR
jgi:CTP:molybdopterin cytidylyltransferase MocA